MKIERIKESNGFKLISTANVIGFKKCKPQISPSVFHDYKDGILRTFSGSSCVINKFDSFRACLSFLLKK